MMDKFKDEYKLFVGRFADRIIELSEDHPLPGRADLPSLARGHAARVGDRPRGAVALAPGADGGTRADGHAGDRACRRVRWRTV